MGQLSCVAKNGGQSLSKKVVSTLCSSGWRRGQANHESRVPGKGCIFRALVLMERKKKNYTNWEDGGAPKIPRIVDSE